MTGSIKRRSKRACDLCFAKRIKCDQREPECSNCKLYHRECRRSVNRSKKDPPTVRPVTETRSGPDAGDDARVNSHHVEVTPPGSSENHGTIPGDPSPSVVSQSPLSASVSSSPPWTFDIVSPTLYHGPSDPSLWLPPLEDLVPIIDYYFQAMNPSLPLFSEPSFMASLTTFLSSSSSSTLTSTSSTALSSSDRRVTWASILVVTALTLQSDHPPHMDPKKRKQWLDYCLRNAQSLLAELTARQEDILGLQVILGLAMLFRSSMDLRPASVLVAIAVRLVYQMQLYSQDTARFFSKEDAEQRVHVFWITYIIDMNISLKLKAPSTLSNVWIDIPKPTSPAGIIHTRDGTAHLNIFHERVKLAEIEAKIFSLLYSTQASPLTPPERQTTAAHVETLLDDWFATIPEPFRPGNAPASVRDEADLLQVASMYQVYLFCQICTRDLWNEGAEWAMRVSSLSRAAMRDITVALQGPRVTPCSQKQERPRMGDSWMGCVASCRMVMRLFHATSKTSNLTVQGVCTLSTAAVVLLANILLNPTQDQEMTVDDFELVAQLRRVFDQLFQDHYSIIHKSLRIILDDLHKLASHSLTTRVAPQSELASMMMGNKEVTDTLDSALLGFDDSIIGFDDQGGIGGFDFTDPMAWGIMTDHFTFNPQSMTS